MRLAPISIALKDGRPALLRSALESDAAEMISFLKTTSAETDFVLQYPDEIDLTPERESALIASVLASPAQVMPVCLVDGRIAGSCQLRFNAPLKVAHRASVAIRVCREYWGLGMGTAMFRALVSLAREKGAHQLELEVMEGNHRAMALYRKMGFETVATHPNFIRLKDGTLLDEYLMILRL